MDPLWGHCQAKDISDATVLEAIRAVRDERTGWSTVWLVWDRLMQFPSRVVRAKLQSMERRGLITGCFHYGTPCRGDIEIVGEK